MSCKTRTQLETGVDTAFGDLIDNMALACEQIDSEQKQDLWMLAGTIDFTHSGGTNTLSWRSSNATTINTHTLDFNTSLSEQAIDINYPVGYDSSDIITAQVTPNEDFVRHFAGFDRGGYRFGAVPQSDKLIIYCMRRVRMSARVTYSGSGTPFNISCYSPLADSHLSAALSATWDSTDNKVIITNTGGYPDFKLNGMPNVTPRPTVDGSGALTTAYIPHAIWEDDHTINVFLTDSSGSQITGSTPPSDMSFNIDFGEIDWSVNMEETDFTSGAALNVFLLAQK